jgi:amino acid permease
MTSKSKIFLHEIFHNPTWGLWLAIAISFVSSILTVVYISSLKNDLQELYEKDFLGQNYMQTARIKLLLIDKEIRNIFFSREPGVKSAALMKINSYRMEIPVFIKKIKPVHHSEFFSLNNETNAVLSEYLKTIDTLLPLSSLGNRNKTVSIFWETMKIDLNRLDVLLDSLDNIKQRHDLHIFNAIKLNLTGSMIFTGIALIISVIVRIFFYRKKKIDAESPFRTK